VADSVAPAALGSTPIPGAAPAGASARYEPDFEQLAAEIAKMESVEGRTTLKWPDVVRLSTTLLSTKSKDLLVASYMTLACFRTKGYGGLKDGLTVCRDMITTFWEGLFPEKARMRARQQAMEWLNERVGTAVVEGRPPGTSDREALTACGTLVEELEKLGQEKFEGSAPDLGALRRAVDDKINAIPSDTPAASDTPSELPSDTPSELPADSAASASFDSAEGARASLAPMRESRAKAAAALRQAAPTDALPYRLLRQASWEELLDVPASTAGQLDFGAADGALAQALEAQLLKGEYAPVIEQAEAALLTNPYWLDLSFFTVRAMEGLGRPYAAARKAVLDEVAWLLRVAPGLLELRFADGSPVASEGAQVWMRNEVAGGAAPQAGMEKTLAEARKLVARKQFPDAVALVVKELEKVSDRRGRFVSRLQLAKLCLEAGKADLALLQLEGLDEEARKFGLDEWEPSLTAELAQELWKCLSSSSAPEKAREQYVRLFRLNPGAALSAAGRR